MDGHSLAVQDENGTASLQLEKTLNDVLHADEVAVVNIVNIKAMLGHNDNSGKAQETDVPVVGEGAEL